VRIFLKSFIRRPGGYQRKYKDDDLVKSQDEFDNQNIA